MAATRAVHQCLFCPQVFDSAGAKDDHVLEHFSQEMCTDCNQNLIRIGSNLYTLHSALTCTKRDLKSEAEIELCTPDYSNLMIKRQYDTDKRTSNEETIVPKIIDAPTQIEQIEEEYIVVDINHLIECRSQKLNQTNNEPSKQQKLIHLTENQRQKLISSKNVQSSTRKQSDLRDSFICDVCGETSNSHNSLQKHQSLVHDISRKYTRSSTEIPSTANFSIDIQRMKSQINSDQVNQKVECYMCKKMYVSENVLRAHVRRMHTPNSKPFTCKICGASFFAKFFLQNHHDLVHLNMKNFICSTCGKAIKSKEALKRHMYQHTGEKPFKCLQEGCERYFRSISGRNEHNRVHTGEKPYQCKINGCNRRFAFAVDFRRHKYKVHDISAKKFPCQVCSQVFPQDAILKKHMQKHNR